MINFSIPSHTRQALDLYVNEGYPVSGFLYAVLTNDLFGAISQADDQNIEALVDVCKHIYNNIPSGCWRTSERVRVWQEHQGLKGLKVKSI